MWEHPTLPDETLLREVLEVPCYYVKSCLRWLQSFSLKNESLQNGLRSNLKKIDCKKINMSHSVFQALLLRSMKQIRDGNVKGERQMVVLASG